MGELIFDDRILDSQNNKNVDIFFRTKFSWNFSCLCM